LPGNLRYSSKKYLNICRLNIETDDEIINKVTSNPKTLIKEVRTSVLINQLVINTFVLLNLPGVYNFFHNRPI